MNDIFIPDLFGALSDGMGSPFVLSWDRMVRLCRQLCDRCVCSVI